MKKNLHGGSRPGSGRKKLGKTPVCIRLGKEKLAALNLLRDASEKSLSETVESLIPLAKA